MPVCAPRAYPWRPEEGIQFPGAGIMNGYKPACGARNNSNPLPEKQVLFTAEPSFQPWLCLFRIEVYVTKAVQSPFFYIVKSLSLCG